MTSDGELTLSIIVPVHNRLWSLPRCLASIASFFSPDVSMEVIFIDDYSTDGSFGFLQEQVPMLFGGLSEKSVILRNAENRGASYARNRGARAARSEWLVFLDSDDELCGTAAGLVDCLRTHNQFSLHMFPALAECQLNAEADDSATRISIADYCRHELPESLPVVRRNRFLINPYREDIRGYESLAYLPLILEEGAVVLHTQSFRVYHRHDKGQLSDSESLGQRSLGIAIGHLHALRMTWRAVPYRESLLLLARALWNLVRHLRWRGEVSIRFITA